ncbi:hypothetical protein RN01_23770 [Cupriavidus sp. SHE]|nr:hypothetical protein RN01_23770 [Cupriavidus sp. SHE]
MWHYPDVAPASLQATKSRQFVLMAINALDFLAGRFRVEQVRVGLPQVNTIAKATLWSRRDARARWEHVSERAGIETLTPVKETGVVRGYCN